MIFLFGTFIDLASKAQDGIFKHLLPPERESESIGKSVFRIVLSFEQDCPSAGQIDHALGQRLREVVRESHAD